MSRIHGATAGLVDWRSRLADPIKHWKRGRSAFEAAVSWERSQRHPTGLPTEIASIFDQRPELADPILVVALIEHKVKLPHGIRPSQNDVWALVRTRSGLVSLAVEAKAGEDFDAPVVKWLAKKEVGSNKEKRLQYILDVLGLTCDVSHVRYQLLHRTASALLEAQRWGAMGAAMVVQSFKNPLREKQQAAQWEDFHSFATLCGASAVPETLARAQGVTRVPLYLGWVSAMPATDEELDSLEDPGGTQELNYPVQTERIGQADPTAPDYSGTFTPPAPYGSESGPKRS